MSYHIKTDITVDNPVARGQNKVTIYYPGRAQERYERRTRNTPLIPPIRKKQPRRTRRRKVA